MKKIVSMILAAGLCWSCSTDFLEENKNPQSLSPGNFWKTEEDVLKGLTAAYASLQPSGDWAATYEQYIVAHCYRSDLCDKRDDVSSWIQVASFTYESNNSVAANYWSYNFTGIYRANQVLEGIENVEGLDPVLKEQYIAEARFLRANYYWNLYLNFGGKLPLWEKPVSNESEYSPAQSTPEVILAFIKTDFEFAQAHLPETYASDVAGRITKGAADAMMGKFLLYQGKYAEAAGELKKVVDAPWYGLNDRYEDNFDGLHKNSKEGILEIQFSGDRSGGKREYTNITEHLASSDATGYEEAYPTRWLYELMLKDTTVDGKMGPRLLATIECPGGRAMNSDGYTVPYEEVHQGAGSPIYWKKFVTWDPSLSSDWWYSAFNVPLIRYADVLLLYAEALNEANGPSQEVFDCINTVRDRVDAPRIPTTWNQAQVREHIRNVERPCELALEGSRWYDLLRWGVVKTTLVAHSKPNASNFIEGKHEVFAIPTSEMTLNRDWDQNPGYGR